MKKSILIVIIIFISVMITYTQEQDNLVTYKQYIQGTVDTSGTDTISFSAYELYRYILTADSSISYKLTGSSDSTYIKAGESITEPPNSAWFNPLIYSKLIIWKTSYLGGAVQYRLWIYGRKK